MSGTNKLQRGKHYLVYAKYLRCFLAVLLFLCTSLSANTLQEIDLVTFEDPPYVFSDKTLKNGLAQVLVDQLLKNSGLSYKTLMMPPKRAELYAQVTPNTCIFPIEKSQEREVFFSWVSPIIVSRHSFFQVKGQKPITLRSLEDAKPYRLGSYLGSSIGDYLLSFGYQVDFANQNDANIHKLSVDRIDLWAANPLAAAHISKTEGIELSESRLDFFTTLKAIGCHPSVQNELIKRMNDELKKMYQSGQIYTLIQKFKAEHF